MKSKVIVFTLMLAGTMTAAAQTDTKQKYYSESFKNNIFISVGAGAQACMNPDNFDYGFGKSITPLVNISVGKFFTPIWGFRGQVAFSPKSKLYSQNAYWNYMYGDNAVKDSYFGINLDGYVNLTNLFCGYKPNRKFEFFAFVGPTMNISKTEGAWLRGHKVNADGSESAVYLLQNNEVRWLVGGSVGLGGKYNINNKWAIDLEVRGTVTPSVYGCKSSAKTDGMLAANLGVTYTFGGKKFVTCVNNEDELNRQINELREALANRPEPKVVEKIVEKEVVKDVEVAGPRAVFFEIGKAKISDQGMVNLKLAAKIIKANPEKVYKLAGYADRATGSKAINEKLSKKRAQAAFDALVKEGVDPKQLEIVPMGGQPNMFGKDALNRVVILE